MVGEQNVNLKLSGPEKDLRKIPCHSQSCRELKEKSWRWSLWRQNSHLLGLRLERYPQIWALTVKQEELKEEN